MATAAPASGAPVSCEVTVPEIVPLCWSTSWAVPTRSGTNTQSNGNRTPKRFMAASGNEAVERSSRTAGKGKRGRERPKRRPPPPGGPKPPAQRRPPPRDQGGNGAGGRGAVEFLGAA